MMRCACLCLTVALAITCPARADLVIELAVEVTQPSSGEFLYDYTLANTAQSDLPVINLNIEIASAANLQSIVAPVGWLATYTSGDTTISWDALDIPYIIAPGSKADFSFLSQLPPQQGDYSVVGFDPNSFSFGSSIGVINGPDVNPVPEPHSIVLLGPLAVVMLAYGWRCVSKK